MEAPTSKNLLGLLLASTLLFACGEGASTAGAPASAADPAQALRERLLVASPNMIADDPELHAYMTQLAEVAVEQHCASCHGPALEGQIGVPNLVDYDWLWGVTGFEMTSVEPVMIIMQTILHGVRDTDCPDEVKRYGACPDTRYSEMPAYGHMGDDTLDDLVEYVLGLSGHQVDEAAAERASALWPVCTECHGAEGFGDKLYGGPDLTNDIWLYGAERGQIRDVIATGRLGYCPPWVDVLDAATIKALAVYIYERAF